MNEKTIGIVAGVGPFAGMDLLGKILHQTIAQTDQDHLTIASISQPNEVMDRTEFLLGRESENPAYAMAKQVRTLAQMGADVVGIPCNTAHAPPIFDVIQQETADSPTQLLHMIEETGRFLRKQYPSVERIGVLSTTGTYLTKIYPTVLEPAGFTVVLPAMAMQEQLIHPAIYADYGIKAHGRATPQSQQDLNTAIATLRQAGAQAIILGCTELPLAITEREINGTIMIDPTLILARALIWEANVAKLRPYQMNQT